MDLYKFLRRTIGLRDSTLFLWLCVTSDHLKEEAKENGRNLVNAMINIKRFCDPTIVAAIYTSV